MKKTTRLALNIFLGNSYFLKHEWRNFPTLYENKGLWVSHSEGYLCKEKTLCLLQGQKTSSQPAWPGVSFDHQALKFLESWKECDSFGAKKWRLIQARKEEFEPKHMQSIFEYTIVKQKRSFERVKLQVSTSFLFTYFEALSQTTNSSDSCASGFVLALPKASHYHIKNSRRFANLSV